MPTLMLRPEDILNGMGLYQPTSTTGTQQVAGTTSAPAAAPAAPVAGAGGQQGAAAGSYLTSFDPSFLNGMPSGVLSNGMQVTGVAGSNAPGNVVHSGEDSNPSELNIAGYSAVDPSHQGVGDTMYDYDAQGQFTGTHTIAPENGTIKDLAQGLATVGAFYLGANALFSGLGAGAGSAVEGAVQGNSINALDAATGVDYGSTALTGGGAEAGGTALTDASSAFNAAQDSQLASDTLGLSPGDTSTLLDPNSIGKINGVDYSVDPSQFTNTDPVFNAAKDSQLANDAIDAGAPGFEDAGPSALANYQTAIDPSLAPFGGTTGTPYGGAGGAPGDGVGPSPEEGGPAGGGPAGGTPNPKDLLNSFDWEKFLKSLLDGFAGLFPSGGGGDPAQTPVTPFVPPQAAVGAGSYSTNAAQGGASGSLSGIAGTLLTTKDNFGYGRSMVG
jgi:hypothetical protein